MRQGDTTQSTAKAPEEFAAACLDSLWKELLHRDQFTNMNSLLLKISRQRFASPCFSAYAASSSDSVRPCGGQDSRKSGGWRRAPVPRPTGCGSSARAGGCPDQMGGGRLPASPVPKKSGLAGTLAPPTSRIVDRSCS